MRNFDDKAASAAMRNFEVALKHRGFFSRIVRQLILDREHTWQMKHKRVKRQCMVGCVISAGSCFSVHQVAWVSGTQLGRGKDTMAEQFLQASWLHR